MESTATRLKKGMELRGLKQADIAELTGISKGALSSYISGRYLPKQNNTYLIAKALNVSESWLMGADVPMERNFLNNDNVQEVSLPRKTVTINVLGRVAAGVPFEAVENIIDKVEIPEETANTGDFFGLQIHGDSMEPRMFEGDIVIVRQQNDAESGDIVIALVNGQDATCKRLIKYESGISLISLNQKYEPMMYTNKDIIEKPVKIIGKVIELRGKV